MRIPHSHTGYTLVELLLYLSLFSIISITLVSVYIATQDARVQQQSVSAVEQRGSLLLSMMSTTIRRAEVILSPANNESGAILALQMSPNAEYPTILARTSTGNLVLGQKITLTPLLDSSITASGFVVRNIAGSAIFFSFDLHTSVPTVPPKIYTRHFESTVTLNPDDQTESGGCSSCPAPSCINHIYQWYHCVSQTCTLSTTTLGC